MLPRRRLGGVICFVAVFFACFIIFGLHFCIECWGDDVGEDTAVVKCPGDRPCANAPTPTVGPFETQQGCCPRHWLDGAVCLVASNSFWLPVVLCFSLECLRKNCLVKKKTCTKKSPEGGTCSTFLQKRQQNYIIEGRISSKATALFVPLFHWPTTHRALVRRSFNH